MACLFSTKPLSESVFTYCQLNHWKQISVKFESNTIIFKQEINLKMSSLKWQPICCGFNVINTLRPEQNGYYFADDICKYVFLNENF